MRRKKTRLNKHSQGGVILTQEEEIVKKILLKDFSGLELLIETYSNHVHQTFLTFFSASDMSQIGDLENQLYFKVWEQIALFNPEKASLKTWLEVLAKNLSYDHLRKEKKNQGNLSIQELAQELPIENNFLEKEQFLALLGYLSPFDQEIFLRFYYYEDSVKEIAADLGQKETKIFNHLSRGRKVLKKKLKKEEL